MRAPSSTPAPVAIVTGASSGIGEATALALIDHGFVVYAGARRVDRMAELAAAGVQVLALDVTDDASMTSFVERVVTDQGRVDVLVNNAGYGSYGAVEDVPITEARRQLEVNLVGLARMTQLVLPHQRRARRGRVINVSSIGGRFWEPLGAWYHASKYAVEGFSDSLRVEVADFGIDVVVIEPGAIATEWGDLALQGAAEFSGGTAYGGHVAALSRGHRRAGRSSVGPEVVAAAITRAATTARPRARYATPASATALMLAIRVLPAQAMDAVIRRTLLGGRVDVSAHDPVPGG